MTWRRTRCFSLNLSLFRLSDDPPTGSVQPSTRSLDRQERSAEALSPPSRDNLRSSEISRNVVQPVRLNGSPCLRGAARLAGRVGTDQSRDPRLPRLPGTATGLNWSEWRRENGLDLISV